MKHARGMSALLVCAGLAVTVSGCREPYDWQPFNWQGPVCSVPAAEIFAGGPGQDGIPALTDPEFVRHTESGASYIDPEERVIGLHTDSGPIAIPLQIMWYHEIVNLVVDGQRIAVTHCPLTGSSLAFDREPLGGVEFGVSGLLFRSNLMMYDRSTEESLWPQMSRGARCGTRDGTELAMIPVYEMRWQSWRSLHPDTRVISEDTGHLRDYLAYPYGDYDELNNSQTLFPVQIDGRRPAKERVLGVPGSEGGIAYPFGELGRNVAVRVVEHDPEGSGSAESVVFWNTVSESAMLFDKTLDGAELTFDGSGGIIVDLETDSQWTVDGEAVSGPLSGRRLEPVGEAYVSFWFAWAAFEPDTRIWSGF